MILKNLYIVGSNKSLQDITVAGESIERIGSSHSEDVNTIDLKGCIAFPGLINSHDHLEFNLYPRLGHKKYNDYVEWGNDIHIKDKELIDSIEAVPLEIRLRYGVIKNLICGVTAVAHHGADYTLLDNSPVSIIRKGTCIHSVRLGGKWKLKINYPVNREPYVIHIGEGISMQSNEEINELLRWNLFNRKLIGIHGIAMTEEQCKKFAALIWCPDSNLFLFGKTADIPGLKKNTKILFGTDSTLTADWNIFENLRTARNQNLLSDEEIFNSLTQEAAEIWEMNDQGKLSAGHKADIVIARQNSDNLFESFFNTNPEDILLVIKNGKIILFDQSQRDVLPEEVIQNKFEKVKVNGNVKFVAYRITETLNAIKKFNLSIPFAVGDC